MAAVAFFSRQGTELTVPLKGASQKALAGGPLGANKIPG